MGGKISSRQPAGSRAGMGGGQQVSKSCLGLWAQLWRTYFSVVLGPFLFSGPFKGKWLGTDWLITRIKDMGCSIGFCKGQKEQPETGGLVIAWRHWRVPSQPRCLKSWDREACWRLGKSRWRLHVGPGWSAAHGHQIPLRDPSPPPAAPLPTPYPWASRMQVLMLGLPRAWGDDEVAEWLFCFLFFKYYCTFNWLLENVMANFLRSDTHAHIDTHTHTTIVSSLMDGSLACQPLLLQRL